MDKITILLLTQLVLEPSLIYYRDSNMIVPEELAIKITAKYVLF